MKVLSIEFQHFIAMSLNSENFSEKSENSATTFLLKIILLTLFELKYRRRYFINRESFRVATSSGVCYHAKYCVVEHMSHFMLPMHLFLHMVLAKPSFLHGSRTWMEANNSKFALKYWTNTEKRADTISLSNFCMK